MYFHHSRDLPVHYEQGSSVSLAVSGRTGSTVTLLKGYKDTDYIVTGSPNTGSSDGTVSIYLSKKSSTQFQFGKNWTGSSGTGLWVAYGYIN